MSREPPPPLPGGYKVGDKLFWTEVSQTGDDGDKLVHGKQGEVVGPARLEGSESKGVAVLFPGNKRIIDCALTNVGHLRAASPRTPNSTSRAPQATAASLLVGCRYSSSTASALAAVIATHIIICNMFGANTATTSDQACWRPVRTQVVPTRPRVRHQVCAGLGRRAPLPPPPASWSSKSGRAADQVSPGRASVRNRHAASEQTM